MKRFLIPAFFVIDVADYEGENAAISIAAEMQCTANRYTVKSDSRLERYLLLDEEIPNREIPILDDETELPHTFNWQAPEPPPPHMKWFTKGDTVDVLALEDAVCKGEPPYHDFRGIVASVSKDFVCVEDQEGNFFACEPGQCIKVDEFFL